MNKQGQVTLFVILAILVVGGIIAFFALRTTTTVSLSADLQPVYDYYLSCMSDYAKSGINLLGEQAGYIEQPAFVPGSEFMPFSSQLDFLGQGVPYWMYVSGNNILREQTPTLSSMQEQLGSYVGERLVDCDFSEFQLRGYDIYVDEGTVDVDINDLDVDVRANNKVTILFGEQSATISSHKLTVRSKLGKFYSLAKAVYDYEKETAFLEDYALDVMRLYAPVTGTEIGCSPLLFDEQEIRQDVINGLAANIPSVKLDGDYYELSSQKRNYFVTDASLNIDENMNFLYSPTWPTKIEIYGDKVVEPVGLQEGMGIMGFCYVPYHFVYDINFPVMVQLYDEQELFQFPVGVVIDNSQPRQALPTTPGISLESPVCEFKNQEVEVNTFDMNLNPVEAHISFKCLNQVCAIGQTQSTGSDATLIAGMPQCVNGFIVARAQGYADAVQEISTNEESSADIIMKKKYVLPLDLGSIDQATVTFSSSDYSATVLYPEQRSIELVEGFYNVTVYAYADTNLRFPAIHERRCVDVPESGLAGIFGGQTEKCFDINVPATDISHALVGGGATQEFVLESVLQDTAGLNIHVPLFATPTSLEELQQNYEAAEQGVVYLDFA